MRLKQLLLGANVHNICCKVLQWLYAYASSLITLNQLFMKTKTLLDDQNNTTFLVNNNQKVLFDMIWC